MILGALYGLPSPFQSSVGLKILNYQTALFFAKAAMPDVRQEEALQGTFLVTPAQSV
eukprot:CAMPEP_0169105930 /NCGR_PEP_ID=MMETSP1015-20121227/24059_1 /TAXON_ID=342587 /ORGANISM="Karlodinium micrum, Strain CCMP2283" /LENGTH=56 /DNA_ID=CAMNT_0009167323 /DNA_START=87 /DNA_END=257 /DNA_ORIENTATION=+